MNTNQLIMLACIALLLRVTVWACVRTAKGEKRINNHKARLIMGALRVRSENLM